MLAITDRSTTLLLGDGVLSWEPWGFKNRGWQVYQAPSRVDQELLLASEGMV
jgi:hypothetical protein